MILSRSFTVKLLGESLQIRNRSSSYFAAKLYCSVWNQRTLFSSSI